MHFYRSLNPIKALTFDLDDTLYDNIPYIAYAEQAMMSVIQRQAGFESVTLNDFIAVKQSLVVEQPDIYHDVLVWRAESLSRFFALYGMKDDQKVAALTAEAMQDFDTARQKITVPQESIDTLSELSKKYPLAVITNGNVDIYRIGLGQYFQFSLRGGADGLSKPFPDLYNLAALKLAVPIENILHVGDYLYTDVQGAINSGMQSCWLNLSNNNIYQQRDARILPHVEINHLSELNNLL